MARIGNFNADLDTTETQRRHSRSARVRFWSNVDVGSPDACWPWLASRDEKGYGRFRGKRAHRLAWEFENGPVPPPEREGIANG